MTARASTVGCRRSARRSALARQPGAWSSTSSCQMAIRRDRSPDRTEPPRRIFQLAVMGSQALRPRSDWGDPTFHSLSPSDSPGCPSPFFVQECHRRPSVDTDPPVLPEKCVRLATRAPFALATAAPSGSCWRSQALTSHGASLKIGWKTIPWPSLRSLLALAASAATSADETKIFIVSAGSWAVLLGLGRNRNKRNGYTDDGSTHGGLSSSDIVAACCGLPERAARAWIFRSEHAP